LRTDVFVPYKLTRLGVVMTPEVGNELEAEGVLNPGSGRTPDGELYLLPRLVAAGNVSRVGLAGSSWTTVSPSAWNARASCWHPTPDGSVAPARPVPRIRG